MYIYVGCTRYEVEPLWKIKDARKEIKRGSVISHVLEVPCEVQAFSNLSQGSTNDRSRSRYRILCTHNAGNRTRTSQEKNLVEGVGVLQCLAQRK